ncbi:MAG: hypothetical protein LBE76_08520, partial [Nitrososphaerota archaeon]|nr:hypothetical protein [Nitrososphaerota archaeon]
IDDWVVFVKVLFKKCHVIGKLCTVVIEQDSDAWCHLGWFACRTGVVFKCNKMVNTSYSGKH